MELPKALKNEIWDYCRVNDIPNIDEFTLKLITQGFTIEKYGATPDLKVVEKVVEKIVEVQTPITDSETSDKLKEALLQIEELQKELAEEKRKNKKDLYGEK